MIKIVLNDVSGKPSETPQYLTLLMHAEFYVGVGYRSLASRGTYMKNELIVDIKVERPKEIFGASVVDTNVD